MTYILGFFDYFLPSSLRSNPSDLMRGYTIVGIIAANIMVSLMVVAGLIYFLDLEENQHIGVSLNLCCLLGYLVTLILLKRTENHVLCSHFLITTLAVVIFYAIQITGGYLESPILQLVTLLPVIAFLLLGLRPGLLWLALTLVLTAACYVSAIMNYGYVQLLQDNDVLQAMNIGLQFTLLIMVGGALFIYETVNSLLNRTLNEERDRFEHKASHDDLTGIPNRFEFFRRLESAVDDAHKRQHKVGVVYIDLDGFKPVNDTYGHHMGDEALKVITARVSEALRLSDTTARLGGDEFGLILPGIHVPNDVEAIMPKVLQAIKEPIRINDIEVVVYGSCGVAIYPDHSKDHNDLCRYADMAMYQAKKQQDSYIVFEHSQIE